MNNNKKRSYIQLAQTGDKDAIHILIKEHQSLVWNVVNKHFSSVELDKDDLFQEGCIGLFMAIKRFDLSQENFFSTYAALYIFGYIQKYINKTGQIHMPVYLNMILSKINNIRQRYRDECDIDMPISEIVDAFNLSKKVKIRLQECDILFIYLNDLSHSEYVNYLSKRKYENLSMDTDFSIEELEDIALLRDIINGALSNLREIERKAIVLMFGLEDNIYRNGNEVGAILGLTRATISNYKIKFFSILKESLLNNFKEEDENIILSKYM